MNASVSLLSHPKTPKPQNPNIINFFLLKRNSKLKWDKSIIKSEVTILWTMMLSDDEFAIAMVHIFCFTRAFIYMKLVHVAYLPVFIKIFCLSALFLELRLPNYWQFSQFIKTFKRDLLIFKVTFAFNRYCKLSFRCLTAHSNNSLRRT